MLVALGTVRRVTGTVCVLQARLNTLRNLREVERKFTICDTELRQLSRSDAEGEEFEDEDAEDAEHGECERPGLEIEGQKTHICTE